MVEILNMFSVNMFVVLFFVLVFPLLVAEVSTNVSVCEDTVPDCDSYKKEDLCEGDFQLYGAIQCRKTCGYCNDSCEDKISNCTEYNKTLDICKTSYTWSLTHCKRFCGFCGDCGKLTAPTNGFVNMSEGSTTYGSKAVYSCETGYTLYGSNISKCEASGHWSDVYVNCTINDCGKLTAPTNATVHMFKGTTYGSRALYICDSGYTLYGSNTSKCEASGHWSDVYVNCTINDCNDPIKPGNGSYKKFNGTTYQAVIPCTCYEGYNLSGATTAVCQANETWSAGAPDCIIKDCNDPAKPGNGSYKKLNGTTYQAVISFNCNEGYNLFGATTAVCQANETWSTGPPDCIIKDCNDPIKPGNGSYKKFNGTTYQAVITYTCNEGYNLFGATTAVCQANETWSAGPPDCIIKAPQRSRMCFGCDDMSSPLYCDSVLHCQANEVCFLESHLLGHGTVFRSGCLDKNTCHFMQSANTGSVCVECCNSDFCNKRGCGNTDFPAREQRGPVCFDCHHTGDPNTCDTVTMCTSNQVCSIEKFQWGDNFHYKQGCSHPVCNSLSRRRRSIPMCHSCCNDDFCNRNCSSNAIDNSGIFVG